MQAGTSNVETPKSILPSFICDWAPGTEFEAGRGSLLQSLFGNMVSLAMSTSRQHKMRLTLRSWTLMATVWCRRTSWPPRWSAPLATEFWRGVALLMWLDRKDWDSMQETKEQAPGNGISM